MPSQKIKYKLIKKIVLLLFVIVIFTGILEIAEKINLNQNLLTNIYSFINLNKANRDTYANNKKFNIPKNITVIGLNKISKSQWESWVDTLNGIEEPILIRKKLLSVHWIKDAQVIRKNSNDFIIIIEENQPIALQQVSHKYFVLFKDGQRDPISNPEKYSNLPLAIGLIEDSNIQDILDLQKFCPEDFGPVKAVRRINNRRWDIILENSLVIKLGNKNWKNRKEDLVKLNKAGFSVLNDLNKVISLDLRVQNIVILQENSSNFNTISTVQY